MLEAGFDAVLRWFEGAGSYRRLCQLVQRVGRVCEQYSEVQHPEGSLSEYSRVGSLPPNAILRTPRIIRPKVYPKLTPPGALFHSNKG